MKESVAELVRAMAKKFREGEYVWQKGDSDPDITTLKYKSPFTGKKFHVSPCSSNDVTKDKTCL